MVSVERSGTRRRVVYGVTVGASAYSLLRGQLGWFKTAGWDVTLATTPDDAAQSAAEREGVELRPIPMSRSITPVADLQAFWRWLGLLAEVKPHAVNVSTPKAGLLGGLAAFLQRVPRRLYVVRGLRLEGASGLLGKVLWLTEWLTMKLATDVLFVSHSLATEASTRRLLSAKKSWLIGEGSSNGVNSDAITARASAANRGELRKQLGLAPDDFVVGFVGRIAKDKGLETLIKAFASISTPHIRLLTIGATEDVALEDLLRALGDRARQVAWTDDVWGHLPAIDVLCLPTLREGFPNVVLEAAAAGIPTITTRATGAVDSVVDGKTGILIDVGDASGIAAQIQRLEADAALVHELGAAARHRVINEFQPESIWQGVAEILEGHPDPMHATRLNNSSTKGEQE